MLKSVLSQWGLSVRVEVFYYENSKRKDNMATWLIYLKTLFCNNFAYVWRFTMVVYYHYYIYQFQHHILDIKKYWILNRSEELYGTGYKVTEDDHPNPKLQPNFYQTNFKHKKLFWRVFRDYFRIQGKHLIFKGSTQKVEKAILLWQHKLIWFFNLENSIY